MRFLILAAALFLNGCAAIYTTTPRVDRESFDAAGKSVVVSYNLNWPTGKGCTAVEACLKGSNQSRAEQYAKLLRKYGFTPYLRGDSSTPDVVDYHIYINEDAYSTSDSQSPSLIATGVASVCTGGFFPAWTRYSPNGMTYRLVDGSGKGLDAQSLKTEVRVVGGVYYVLANFLNRPTLKHALEKEHERALQMWIQGGLFE